MSRIIRPYNVKLEDTSPKAIEIKSVQIFNQQFEVEEDEELSITDILLERDRLLEDAQQQISFEKNELEALRLQFQDEMEQLRFTWEEEKLTLQQQAYEEGFAQGYEEGLQKATNDMTENLKRANEVVDEARENAKKYIAEQEYVVLDIALKSAERILGHVLDQNSEEFLSIIKRGLKEAREMKEIKLYVSPENHELVSANWDELSSIFPVNVPFMVFVNEDMDNTESVIETNHGRIVVSVDEQLNELRIKLIELLESQG